MKPGFQWRSSAMKAWFYSLRERPLDQERAPEVAVQAGTGIKWLMC